MVFSSFVFLFLFLPIVLLLYYVCPARGRNVVLLAASLLFYAWGEPVYVLIMLFSTVFDYTNGRLIAYFSEVGRKRAAKAVLIVDICGNLGILGFFKYADFLIESVNSISGAGLSLLQIALPIGISFYTFQTMSYTIDVYRGIVPPQKNILTFGTYVAMFPQLIAGPIVQYKSIGAELEMRHTSIADFSDGALRFTVGLAKKVVLANQVGSLAAAIFAAERLTAASAWLGAAAYTFQIYFDFSGYSDMAIGLGRMFGFHFPENFDHPYTAKSVTEFWRRWHISLGSWFREYVYIPLGGNRRGLAVQIRNILIVWMLTGLWHGASWNFVLWGLYYGALLIVEKIIFSRKNRNDMKISKKKMDRGSQNGGITWNGDSNISTAPNEKWKTKFAYNNGAVATEEQLGQKFTCVSKVGKLRRFAKTIWGHIYTLFFVVLGWVIFSQTEPMELLRYLKAMAGIGVQTINSDFFYYISCNAVLFLVLVICSLDWTGLLKKAEDSLEKISQALCETVKIVVLLLLFGFSLAFLVGDSYNPFLYFRF
jgi:alginate O-acetyltransferase complex protein AlgI